MICVHSLRPVSLAGISGLPNTEGLEHHECGAESSGIGFGVH